MYYVKITKLGHTNGLTEQLIKLKTEKFYELIGRYTTKMGAPEEITQVGGVTTELAFYERPTEDASYVTVEYVKIAKDGEVIPPKHATTQPATTTVAPEPTEDKSIVDERLVAMANDGCFKVA